MVGYIHNCRKLILSIWEANGLSMNKVLLKTFLVIIILLYCVFLLNRDRFRTTVNVLGDSFGVGIVQHYSRKQLGNLSKPATSPMHTPPNGSMEAGLDSNHHLEDTPTHNHSRSPPRPDYGTASPPPPSLPTIATPEWSISSNESSRQGTEGGERARKRLSIGSVGSLEKLKEETNL